MKLSPEVAAKQLGLEEKIKEDVAFYAWAAAITYRFAHPYFETVPEQFEQIYKLSLEEAKKLNELVFGTPELPSDIGG